jgi:single-stranded DNA-binding protein
MSSKNLFVIAGNAVRDGELFKGVGKLTVATTEKGVKKDGSDFEKTSYLSVTAFGYLANDIINVKKGQFVVVTGKITDNSYEKSGIKVSTLQLIADDIKIGVRVTSIEQPPQEVEQGEMPF